MHKEKHGSSSNGCRGSRGSSSERRAEGLLGLTRRASQEDMRAAGLGQLKTHRYFSTSSYEDGATHFHYCRGVQATGPTPPTLGGDGRMTLRLAEAAEEECLSLTRPMIRCVYWSWYSSVEAASSRHRHTPRSSRANTQERHRYVRPAATRTLQQSSPLISHGPHEAEGGIAATAYEPRVGHVNSSHLPLLRAC